MSTLYRWFPERKCLYNGRLWSPENENDVLIAEDAPHHFRKLGPVKEEESVTVESDYQPPVDTRKISEKKKTSVTISELTEDERAGMIRDAAEQVDRADRTKWYRGVPTEGTMRELLPFSPKIAEIIKAIKG